MRDRTLGLRPLAALLFLAMVCLGTATTTSWAFVFTRITDAGNPIVADGGHTSTQYYFGSAWIDFDDDGDQDLFLDQSLLYRNDGGGTFTRLDGTGIGDGQIASGAFSMSGTSWADYDNDGDLDCFVAGEASYLYRNDGSETFTRITTGDIGGGTANRGWTCAWGDYNNDSYVDLVIIHPAGFIPGGPPLPNKLFLNDGPPAFSFTEIFTGPIVTGLDSYTVGSWSDHDDDGDLDLFIGSGPANGTFQADNLYRNELSETGDATFVRILDAPIGSDQQDGQLWNWIDYDNDGDLDAYLTNWGGSSGGRANRLYQQQSDGSFLEIAGQPGAEVDVSLTSTWADFDNDGDLDVFVGNDGASFDRLYENNGDGTFTARTDTPITSAAGARRSSGAVDYDNDGDIDLFTNGALTSRALYRNDTNNGNGYLNLTLRGVVSNHAAIGAKVRVKANISSTEIWQLREVSAQNAFNGHSSLRAHFGLGDAATADSVVISWPSGIQTVLTDVAANQFLEVEELAPSDAPPVPIATGVELAAWPNPAPGETTLRYHLGQSGPVELSVWDAAGRKVAQLIETRTQSAGRHRVTWDALDVNGHPVPSGTYWMRLVHGDDPPRTRTETLVVVR